MKRGKLLFIFLQKTIAVLLLYFNELFENSSKQIKMENNQGITFL